MRSPIPFLLAKSFRTWISAKGFWMVFAASLLPLVLAGGWALTHRADVAIAPPTYGDAILAGGQNVTFFTNVTNVGPTSVGEFNVSVAVGTLVGSELRPATGGSTTVTIDGLAPGASRPVELSWTASPGVWIILAQADVADGVGEIDEFNNQRISQLIIDLPVPPGLEGNASATDVVDLRVESLDVPDVNDTAAGAIAFSAVVTNAGSTPVVNASLLLQAYEVSGSFVFPRATQTFTVNLTPGERATFAVNHTATTFGWFTATLTPPATARDSAARDNHASQPFSPEGALERLLAEPDPPERQTIKEFYSDVLSLLHFRFLLPLVALFYAAGVVTDERERGALTYILTRPVPRALIPATKFLASFLVAAVAAVAGIVLTYLLLFQTMPQAEEIGYLTTPLIAGLLVLFVYGGLFTLLGVMVDRPYVVGVAFLLGWELLAGIFVPWVGNLTVTQHIANALTGWPLGPFMWMPEGDQPARAFWLLLGIGAVALAASTRAMKRREFSG